MTRRNWLRFALGLAFCAASATALFVLQPWLMGPREPEYRRFGAKTRSEWIELATQHLKAFAPSRREPEPEVWMDGCIRFDNEGFLRFSDGGWVYVICHSGHSKTSIGDIALAIDDRGRLYFNDAHQCPGLILNAPNGMIFRSASDFFATVTPSNSVYEPHYWKPLDELDFANTDSPPSTPASPASQDTGDSA